MSNKKQIRLTTINLDQCIDLPSSDGPRTLFGHSQAALVHSSNPPKGLLSSSSLSLKDPSQIKRAKIPRRSSLFIDRLKQLQINQVSIEKYIPPRPGTPNMSLYQQFPKRTNSIKNGNAFKFYLNSAQARRRYSESIVPLKKIQAKLSQITHRKVSLVRLFSSKTRTPTEPVPELYKQHLERPRRPLSGSSGSLAKAKGERCETTIDAWETWESREGLSREW